MKQKPQENSIAVQLVNISKEYTIHHEKPTLAEKLYKGKEEKFWALKNINLTINKGDWVGIIGSNGSGKTTILKIIAGIATPTEGKLVTHGTIVSLIDLEAGFHDDLTGIQNIYLNGMLLGMDKHTVDKNFSRIVAFADIHQFIDAPLFTYSSGMKLRLGFAIAIHAKPDILILDENISVGDQYFQVKAIRTIRKLAAKNRVTVIYVSHNGMSLRQLCRKFIWLDQGKIYKFGGRQVLSNYMHI